MDGRGDQGSVREDREEVGGGHVRGRTFCSQAPGPDRPQTAPEWPTHKGNAFLPQLLCVAVPAGNSKAQSRREGSGISQEGRKKFVLSDPIRFLLGFSVFFFLIAHHLPVPCYLVSIPSKAPNLPQWEPKKNGKCSISNPGC